QQPAAQQRQLLHYDATGRIIASQDSLHGQRETFTYDAAANLLDGPAPGAGLVVHNKLLTYQDKRYRYDAFGRMIEKRSAKRGVQHFAYDAESRLIEVRSDNGSVVKMAYDPLGRRIEKTEHDSNGYPLGETRFTWDGLRLLQEHRHQQTSLYLYEDDGYEPLARVDGSSPLQKIRYYHNDLNGLPEQLTEADGHNVWQATYRVWGNTLEEVREPYYIEEQNLRFQGQYLDRETGLHFNTFRFYDPDVGRFTTPDPIGLAGGANLYQYAPNPLGWIDPWGWAPCGSTTKKLQAHANAAKKAVYRNPQRSLTLKQRAAVKRAYDRGDFGQARSRYRRYVGQRIDAEFKRRVLADPSLAHLNVAKSGQRLPDVYDPKSKSWWDLTTKADWKKGTHQRRYGDWGNGYEGVLW
ncbi:RHS repeat domain-containing protein, partial [Pseudomonas sp. RL_105y_Pfl2_101]|uniref:RHS repeat domain-containing protein n=1 Tax=Pseudomonas sp. RL_105y_Pfl2_101 TaxID=3088708 RepID=UPI0030DCF973